jgi:hypothetical protein
LAKALDARSRPPTPFQQRPELAAGYHRERKAQGLIALARLPRSAGENYLADLFIKDEGVTGNFDAR